MSVFSWDQRFETGIKEVDNQHFRLFNMTNHFGEMLSQDEVDQNDINSLLIQLIDYTDYHFKEEESLMQQLDIPEEHSSQHKQEHKQFLDEVLLLGKEYEKATHTGQDLFEFLMNWLVYHILGTDMNMACEISRINKDETIRSADNFNGGEATDLLLKALNNMFQKVSKRNRELTDLNQTLEDKVRERTDELVKTNQRLQELASTDMLTGLFNRRQAMHLLRRLWLESEQEQYPLSCLMVDADNFKQINDAYGHDAGDLVLKELARELRHAVRTDDIVSRLGGDEFLIICPATDLDGANNVALTTHKKICQLEVKVPGDGRWKGSISVGIGVRDSSMKKPEDLIKMADRSVYAAKSAGRNCVRSVQTRTKAQSEQSTDN